MSLFITYSEEASEYVLHPAGYAVLVVLMLLVFFLGSSFLSRQKTTRASTRQLAFSGIAIAFAMIASTFLKLASLPFGGSITAFSMLFICLIGYIYGPKAGIMTAVAYGIMQLIIDPYLFTPVQVLLDFPLAFGSLGLSGIFWKSRHGLLKGYILGVTGRYLFHVISGYVFFAEYAPENMNPILYTLGYNATYIVPELIATIIIIAIPPMANAIVRVKEMANAA